MHSDAKCCNTCSILLQYPCNNISQAFLLGASKRMAASAAHGQVFVGPGLSPFKRIMTIIGVVGVIVLVLWTALHQGASAIGSTMVALRFMLGFVIYLLIVAPVPFTIELDPE